MKKTLKRISLFTMLIMICIFWGYRFYKVNHAFARIEPPIFYEIGEEYQEDGISYKVVSVERFKLDEYLQKYPEIGEMRPSLKADLENEEDWDFGFLWVTVEIQNHTEESQRPDLSYWLLELFGSSTYSDPMQNQMINAEKKQEIEPGEKETYLLSFPHYESEENGVLRVYMNQSMDEYAKVGWNLK